MMQLTKDDKRVGTINEDGSYNYPSLTITGQAFSRGGGYSTRRLDENTFIVYIGNLTEKVELKEEAKSGNKSKRETPDNE